MQGNLISIVMPVKNASAYLSDCLESILLQSEKNWELLALDDGSEDNSFEILSTFSERDVRIHCFKNDGDGIISSLQKAYSKSKGEFIHRMDADDLMPKNKLSLLKKVLTNAGKGHVATGKVNYFSSEGISEGYFKYQEWLNGLIDSETHWEELFKECVIASPAWMIHRSDFDLVGAFNSTIYPEDYDLVFRFFEHNIKVVACKEIIHLWRDHAARTSRNHIHYQQNSFLELKLHYFLKLIAKPNKQIVLWGAGRKGKIMAKLLKEQNKTFEWVSDNPNKIGQDIYKQVMQSYEKIVTHKNPQIIITVAQRNAKNEIITFLSKQGLVEGVNFWFFC